MAHILHLLEDQTGDKSFWNKLSSNPYDAKVLERIKDNVDDIGMSITSIPSPFARMMIVDAAFALIIKKNETNKSDQLAFDGDSIYHRLASETLDVFELLFSVDELNLKNNLKIDYWTLSSLESIRGVSAGLDNFIESIHLHLNNYKKNDRFKNFSDPFQRITLIYLNDRLIGGSSPYTGFFTSAIEAEKENGERLTKRKLTGEYLFDSIVPLYKRSLKFQKFMNLFFENQPKIKKSFKYLYQYIKLNRSCCLDAELKENLVNIDNKKEFKDEFNEFTPLSFDNQAIELLPGIPFVYESVSQEDFEFMVSQSDYRIRTRKRLSKDPLVFAKNLKKTSWKYLKSTSVPQINFEEKNSVIEKRELPESGGHIYPWITKDDLLSENLLDIGYDIRKERFWTPLEFDSKYLLPIKKAYFDYFTIEDLKENLTMVVNSDGSIMVDLTIPTTADNNRGQVVFRRKYIVADPYNIQDDNLGAIVESSFFLGIFPFFQLPQNEAKYNDFSVLSLLAPRTNNIEIETRLENLSGQNIGVKAYTNFKRTRKDEGLDWSSTYLEFRNSISEEDSKRVFYDLIHIEYDNVENSVGTIIPKYTKVSNISGSTRSFAAVDFGTSNSFVAISFDGRNTMGLSNYKKIDRTKELLFEMLHSENADLQGTEKYDISIEKSLSKVAVDMMLQEFMPSLVSDDDKYKFLIPTMINQDNDTNTVKEADVIALVNTNIPFAIRDVPIRTKMDFVNSNLKWKLQGNEIDEDYIRAYAFLEEIAIIIQKRVLIEGLNPANTAVLWSKPLSMDDTTSGRIESIWNKLYVKYFSKQKDNTQKVVGITESIAPFYSENFEFGSGENYLNLDIGGGTTDLILFNTQEPVMTTSFKFAGNNLFDAGVNENSSEKENGFVKKFYREMERYLENNDLIDKKKIAEQIFASSKLGSEDLISFYFSIPTFVDKLKGDLRMKLLFLLHNSALFYHSAQILKASNHPVPDNIGFSGMGSRLLNITNGGKDINDRKLLLGLVRRIFQHVYQTEELPDFGFKMMKNPKRSTAIGAIKGYAKGDINSESENEHFAKVLIGDQSTVISRYGLKKEDVEKNSYGRMLSEKKFHAVTENFKAFVSFFFDELWYENSIVDYFAIDKSLDPEKIKEYMCSDNRINGILHQVLTDFKKQGLSKKAVSESLFFYPMKAFIYEMSKELAAGGDRFK